MRTHQAQQFARYHEAVQADRYTLTCIKMTADKRLARLVGPREGVASADVYGRMGALIALGLLCTAWAYVLFYRLIAEAGPAKALTVTFMVPLFALLYGALLLGEQVTLAMVAKVLSVDSCTV